MCSSDDVAARIDELHFEIGEGPQWAAARTGEIVHTTDVANDTHHDWPVFGAALRQLPVGSLFCIPMRMGAVTLGVASLYSQTPRTLTDDQQETAIAIASAIAGPAAHQALNTAAAEPDGESHASVALRREVHQATGMLIVQLDTTATVAFARLQAYAFANGRTLEEVAHDIVSGALILEDPAS